MSNKGQVRASATGRILTINYDRFKRLNAMASVELTRDDDHKRKRFYVHRLMLHVFQPFDDNSQKMFASHIDGNKYNNNLTNLQWRTQQEVSHNAAMRNAHKHGRSVMLTLLNHDKIITMIQLTSIKDCIKAINEFFDCKIKCINPCQHRRYISDKGVNSHKKIVVQYVDQSHYNQTVTALNEKEEWKLVSTGDRNQTYFVSNLGRFKVVYAVGKKEKLLKQAFRCGYCCIYFPIDGIGKCRLAHRIVAQHFVDNPNGYNIIDHKDANRQNNKATNLQWVQDAKQNASNPKTRAKCILQHRVLQLDKVTGQAIKEWSTAHAASKALSIYSSGILSCCRKKLKSTGGFAWQFKDTN